MEQRRIRKLEKEIDKTYSILKLHEVDRSPKVVQRMRKVRSDYVDMQMEYKRLTGDFRY